MNFVILIGMSCKCFDNKPSFSETDSFDERYKQSKCHCNSRFTVCENKSKFTIDTKDLTKVDKIKVDSYLDSSPEHQKCDYLFVCTFTDQQTYIFVELKGKNIAHAITQISNTITMFYNNGHLYNKKVIAAIVSSRYPSNDGTYRKAKINLERSLSSKIKEFRVEKKNVQMTYNPTLDKVS